jgi:formylglycine-generating enzyme required for sulfatase activity
LCWLVGSCVALAGVTTVAVAIESAPRAVVADANAATEAEMKPYSEPIQYANVSIEMVPIPGGTFTMGSPESEADRGDDEGPQHQVEVAPFWMGKYEVTWDQYDAWGERLDTVRRDLAGVKATELDLMVDGITRPTEPYTDMSFGMGKGSRPAICMTQHAARTFCQWLSAATGRYYRLPTEAEWEYACRAGTTTAYSFGDDPAELDDYAWYFDNTNDEYEKVGKKKPNPWGLFDMHGNASEWVLDQYAADTYAKRKDGTVKNPLQIPTTEHPRIVRGGSWQDDADKLRSSTRVGSSPEWKEEDPQIPQSIWYHTNALGVGFRIVRPLVEPPDEEKAAKWDNSLPVQLDPVE